MTWFLLFAPILFCAWRSYRKGLFMAIISLCVLAVAYWISWEFAPKIALYVTTKGGLIGILVAVVVGVLLFFLCTDVTQPP